MDLSVKSTAVMFWRIIALGLLTSFVGIAQDSLSLSPGSAPPAGSVALNLDLNSANGSAPAGLQWTFSYSPSAITSVSVAAGPSASAAGKSVSCAEGAG